MQHVERHSGVGSHPDQEDEAEAAAHARKLSRSLDLFERAVTIVLTALMAVVVLLSVAALCWALVRDLMEPGVRRLDAAGLMEIFGAFLLVLIGVELLETLRAYVYEREIRAEVIVLVAVIALARKLITLDASHLEPGILLGLAALMAALSLAYRMIRSAHRPKAQRGDHLRSSPTDGDQPLR
jgi:uncharacterized membrane protein (DUF373 family)